MTRADIGVMGQRQKQVGGQWQWSWEQEKAPRLCNVTAESLTRGETGWEQQALASVYNDMVDNRNSDNEGKDGFNMEALVVGTVTMRPCPTMKRGRCGIIMEEHSSLINSTPDDHQDSRQQHDSLQGSKGAIPHVI